jgi:hypothetical protein
MEESRTTFLNACLTGISGWIGSNRLIVLATALTTIFGLIAGASTAFPVVLKALDVPDCFTYAAVYRGPGSYFKNEGAVWREYPPDGGGFRYEFREVQRTRDSIKLLNLTPRPDLQDASSLLVHLPVCGGTATLSIGLPERTFNLEEVWRE